MKNALKSLAVIFALSASAVQAHADPGHQKILGSFHSQDGTQFVVSRKGAAFFLRTNAELSKYGLCASPISISSTLLSSSEGFAQLKFDPKSAGCRGMDGPIVLHYNRALTGIDVHLIDVVIRSPRGRDRGLTMRWSLRRLK
jgi:hypothetical protein